MPLARKYFSRRSTMPVTSAMIRLTTSGSERVPTPATCGSPAIPAKVPPPKSSTKNCDSCGVVVSAIPATTDRSVVLLPLRGPPTTARWPAPPDRSTDRVSRRCSRGRSTVPRGTTRPPSARHSCDTRPSCGSTARSGISSSRVSGTSSGGSQTWWAAGPWPTMWSTAMSSSDCWSPAVDRRRLGLRLVDRDVELEHLRDRERQDALELAALVAADPHPAGRRPRDVGGLEPHHRGRVRLEVGQPRDRRQLVGVGDAEHRARLLRRERAQPDPVGQVRLQAAEPALLEPLRGEQQVQPERAAEPADGDEEVDELRLGREHLGELVDHDEQRRQRLRAARRWRGPSRSRGSRRSCRPRGAAPGGAPSRRTARPACGRRG